MTQATETIVKAHTPGPWSVGERPKPKAMLAIRAVSISHPGPGKAIGYCYREADAALIRESPAMLGLLKEFVGLVRGASPIKDEAEALIVRVEGRS